MKLLLDHNLSHKTARVLLTGINAVLAELNVVLAELNVVLAQLTVNLPEAHH